MKTAKVLLVDDHDIVRAAFKHLLDSHSQIQIIAQASNSQEAFAAYKKASPDIVIMDLSMPSDASSQATSGAQGGIEAIQRIIAHDALAKIIVLSAWDANPYTKSLVKAGVKGYLTKNCDPAELVQAVLDVYLGRTHFSESIKAILNDGDAEEVSPAKRLTKREFEIFTLLAEGHTATQIAESKFVSHKTVHAHRANLMRKLALSNNSEIVHLAIRHGIVCP